MNSGLLKTEALAWLRFHKRMDYVCTEGGYWSADVLGACDQFVIEVEVKTSRADLLAEFRNKTTKHAYYQNHTNWSPNYFYFLVPVDLGPEAVEIIKEKMPKAGVLVYQYPRMRHGERLKCLRKPTKLHSKKPIAKFTEAVRRREASELCGLHIAMDELRATHGITEIEAIKKSIIDAIVSALEPEVWERVDGAVSESDGVFDAAASDSGGAAGKVT
jgi:hypothetical protein